VFTLVSAASARAQAPVQTSTQATAQPPDNDFYAVRQPAAAGNAQAQFALANHYFYGLGVPQDYRQALLWYNKSANQGFAPAQNLLGYMYQHMRIWGEARLWSSPCLVSPGRRPR
jgi:TPR repeat protein